MKLVIFCVFSRNSTSSSSTLGRSESTASNSSVKRGSAPVAEAEAPASPLHTSSEQHDSFDNEDDEEDLVDSSVSAQPIGVCVALYPFDGKFSHSSAQ